MITFASTEHTDAHRIVIKVVGIGGAGGNAVSALMKSAPLASMQTLVVNTDAQALALVDPAHRLQIGTKTTKGLGTGDNPEIGKLSAQEDLAVIIDTVGHADVVFLIAGMGGGTGSGALPVVARALRDANILTIAIVTKPFIFEGKRRARVAEEAIKDLAASVDTLIVVPNQTLLDITAEQISMLDGFAMINKLLADSICGIADIITKPGHINVDFADVCTIMKNRGLAVMGTGRAAGPQRAQEAARLAISSPLLEHRTIAGAQGILLNICGGKNLGLHEIHHAASAVYELAAEDAHIIIGSVIDENLSDEVVVTIIATGFPTAVQEQKAPQMVCHTAEVAPEVKQVQVRATVLDKSESSHASLSAKTVTQLIQSDLHSKYKTSVAQLDSDLAIKEDKSANAQAHQQNTALLVTEANSTDLDVPTFMRMPTTQQ